MNERLDQIALDIHALLLEACTIADERDKILSASIGTEYIHSAGRIGINFVSECSLTVLEK